jgi:hypothetical protein
MLLDTWSHLGAVSSQCKNLLRIISYTTVRYRIDKTDSLGGPCGFQLRGSGLFSGTPPQRSGNEGRCTAGANDSSEQRVLRAQCDILHVMYSTVGSAVTILGSCDRIT